MVTSPTPSWGGLFLAGGGNILALVLPGRITVRGQDSLRKQGVVAVLEDICPAPSSDGVLSGWFSKSDP